MFYCDCGKSYDTWWGLKTHQNKYCTLKISPTKLAEYNIKRRQSSLKSGEIKHLASLESKKAKKDNINTLVNPENINLYKDLGFKFGWIK